jgi:hypothetical protein
MAESERPTYLKPRAALERREALADANAGPSAIDGGEAALAGADMAEVYGTQLASLSGTQLRALSTTAVGALVETQVAALTTTQLCEIDALTDDESFYRARLARRHYHHPMDADGRLWAGEEKPDAQRARAKPKAA